MKSSTSHEHHKRDSNMNYRGPHGMPQGGGGDPRMQPHMYPGNQYHSQPHMGHPGYGSKMKSPQQPPYAGGMNYRQYRDNTHARQFDSPSKPHAPPTRNLLDEIDDVNNHGGGSYGDDRVQNELLKEICGDIGIDEAMDLDLFDFDAPADSYFFPSQGRLQNDLDFSGFGDLDAQDGDTTLVPPPSSTSQLKQGQHQQSTESQNISQNSYSTSSYQTKIPSSGMEKGEFSPYSQSVPSVKSSVGEPHREVAIDSPTVSSSVPNSTEGSVKSNAASNGGSVHGSVGSPSVHSTTPSLQEPYESLKPPSSASLDSMRAPGSVESAREGSPGLAGAGESMSTIRQDSADSTSHGLLPPQPRMHRSESVGSPASQHDIRNSMRHNSCDNLPASPGAQSRGGQTDGVPYTSSFKSEVFTCYSQPASPNKNRPIRTNSGGMHKAQSMNDNLHRQAVTKLQSQMSYQSDSSDLPHTDDQKALQNNAFKVPPALPCSTVVKQEPSSTVSRSQADQGYFSQASTSSVYGSSHYGSSSNVTSSMATSSTLSSSSGSQPDSKEKVRTYLQQQQNFNGHVNESPFDISSHPSTADLNIPAMHSENQSASSSQSNSPTSMHIAKRARVINTGNDLLADVREQFSYVKGADMFAPPTNMPPVQRARPTPYAQGYNQRMALNMQVPSQFNFGGNSSNSMPFGNSMQSNANRNNNMGSVNSMNGPQINGPHMNGPEMSGPGKNAYPGMNGPQRPNSSGFATPNPAENQQPGMYPNSMYPSQSSNQAFSQPSSQSLDMSSSQQQPGPAGMTVNTRNIQHMQNSSMARGATPGEHPGTPQNMHMGMPNRANMMGAMPGENSVGPMGPGQYANSQTPYDMNPANRGGNQMGGHKLDSMGNPMPNQGSYSNPPMSYGSQGNMNQSQFGPSQGSMRPGQMGYHGNTNPGYRSQSPNYLPGAPGSHQNMNSMGGGPMVGNNMKIHGPNMSMPSMGPSNTKSDPYGNDITGSMGVPNGPNMPPNMQPHDAHAQNMGPMGAIGPPGPGDMNPGAMGPHPGAPMMPQRTLKGPNGERLRPPPEGLMQQIISDRSSAFRSHPLFPLLRDLIIADMNFNTPSFPFQLIANLPADFEKLLQNYLNRNPPSRNQQVNPSVEGVIMDALKYAHQSLIEKIQVKKQSVGYQDTPKPLSAIEDFCERFDRAVKNSFSPKTPAAPVTPSKAPRTPSKSSSSAAPGTPKKESSKTDNEKANTPNSKTATAGRNKVLPKEAVAFMLDWLREHQDNPYPNDDEKEMLITKTKLTINQINYWFTNARRRILPKWALQRYMEQQQHSPFGPRLTPM